MTITPNQTEPKVRFSVVQVQTEIWTELWHPSFLGPTLEHVGLTAINILDCWHWLEEHIDRCILLLA